MREGDEGWSTAREVWYGYGGSWWQVQGGEIWSRKGVWVRSWRDCETLAGLVFVVVSVVSGERELAKREVG